MAHTPGDEYDPFDPDGEGLPDIKRISLDDLHAQLQSVPVIVGEPTGDHDDAVRNALFSRAVGTRTWRDVPTKDGVVRVEADVLPDVAAQKLWLQARQPDQWAEKRTAEVHVIVQRLGPGSEREAVGQVIEHAAQAILTDDSK